MRTDKEIADGFSILHIATNENISNDEPFEKLSFLRVVPSKLVINPSDTVALDFVSACANINHC